MLARTHLKRDSSGLRIVIGPRRCVDRRELQSRDVDHNPLDDCLVVEMGTQNIVRKAWCITSDL